MLSIKDLRALYSALEAKRNATTNPILREQLKGHMDDVSRAITRHTKAKVLRLRELGRRIKTHRRSLAWSALLTFSLLTSFLLP